MIHTSCRSESSFNMLGRLDKSLLDLLPTHLTIQQLRHNQHHTISRSVTGKIYCMVMLIRQSRSNLYVNISRSMSHEKYVTRISTDVRIYSSSINCGGPMFCETGEIKRIFNSKTLFFLQKKTNKPTTQYWWMTAFSQGCLFIRQRLDFFGIIGVKLISHTMQPSQLQVPS